MEISSPQSAQLSGIEYPPPPRVHWLVLLVISIVSTNLVNSYAPHPYRELLNSLPVDAWAFYLCLWIRKLDPDAHSPFWCHVSVIVELGYAAATIRQNPSHTLEYLIGVLAVISLALGIATIYLIRADLLKHYNEREPIGLQLGPVLTFFFSFFYFQSQLYDIAQFKRRQAQGLDTGAGRTLLP